MIEGRRLAAGEAILDGTNIERDRAGNTDETWEATLESVVREHSRLVYRIAYSVLRRHHDAEDAAQETFMRVLRYRSKLAGVRDAKTWLARVAWRGAVDRSRRQGRLQEAALENPESPVLEIASGDDSAEEALQGTQIRAMLETLIAALPRKLREPLILSTIEEMSPRQVADT